jgi:hypothetical protein
MKILLSSFALIGLLATIAPSILVFSGAIELEMHKIIMAGGMILWFITAPFLMKRKDSA